MPAELVDVIFLDIDGVLLPFGGTRDGYSKDDNPCTVEGCIFPDRAMDALTVLLRRVSNDDFNIMLNGSGVAAKGNPVIVLSSTWRARSEFIQDILDSFRAYAAVAGGDGDDGSCCPSERQATWEPHLHSFFDIADPNFHSTRHDEIYKWVREHAQNCGGKGIVLKSQYSIGSVRNGTATSTKKRYIVRTWIALDDEDLVNVEGRVSQDATKHAVRTESSVGLTLRDVDLAVDLIEKQMLDFHAQHQMR